MVDTLGGLVGLELNVKLGCIGCPVHIALLISGLQRLGKLKSHSGHLTPVIANTASQLDTC